MIGVVLGFVLGLLYFLGFLFLRFEGVYGFVVGFMSLGLFCRFGVDDQLAKYKFNNA
jgi:hypothetical protein